MFRFSCKAFTFTYMIDFVHVHVANLWVQKSKVNTVHSFCLDLSVCGTGNQTCHVNATCTDTDEGYTCVCNPGFAGNGTCCFGRCISSQTMCTCVCACMFYKHAMESYLQCSGSAARHSLLHTWLCMCMWKMYGCKRSKVNTVHSFCLDLSVCGTGNQTCHVNATCTDTDEGYTCECNPGFAGNGTYCFGRCMWQFTDKLCMYLCIHVSMFCKHNDMARNPFNYIRCSGSELGRLSNKSAYHLY